MSYRVATDEIIVRSCKNLTRLIATINPGDLFVHKIILHPSLFSVVIDSMGQLGIAESVSISMNSTEVL